MCAIRIRADARDDLGPVAGTELLGDLRRCAGEYRDTRRREYQYLIAPVEVGGCGGRDHDDTSIVGEPSQRRPKLLLRCRFESGGGFVEDEQRRTGQQFRRQ